MKKLVIVMAILFSGCTTNADPDLSQQTDAELCMSYAQQGNIRAMEDQIFETAFYLNPIYIYYRVLNEEIANRSLDCKS